LQFIQLRLQKLITEFIVSVLKLCRITVDFIQYQQTQAIINAKYALHL